MSAQKAKEKALDEIAEGTNGDNEENESGSDASEDEEPTTTTAGGESIPHAITPSTASKKKKKKRSKALQALNALRGKDSLPQDVVNVVMEKVRAEGGEVAANADEATIRAALEQMKLKDVIQGKAGIGGKNKKDAGDHKVGFASLWTLRSLNDVDLVLGDTTSASAR